MSVSIIVSGDTNRLLRRMRTMENIDKRRIFNSIGESLRTSTMERFRAERSPEGMQWEKSKRAEDEGGKTLTDTAVLRNSIHTELYAKGVAVGTNDIRAKTHQFGSKRTIKAKNGKYLKFKYNGSWVSKESVKINIPARPFLGLSEEDIRNVADVIESIISAES